MGCNPEIWPTSWGLEVLRRYGKYRDCSPSMRKKFHEGCRSRFIDIGPDAWESMAANCFPSTTKNWWHPVKLTLQNTFAGRQNFSKKTATENGKIPWSSKVRGKITWKNHDGKIVPWWFSLTVTGVSGWENHTLIKKCFNPALRENAKDGPIDESGKYDRIEGDGQTDHPK